jgi:anti-anti-sigma regulatory factor
MTAHDQRPSFLQISQEGDTTTVAFRTSRVPEDDRFGELQEALLALSNENCRRLHFDLSGVRIIPSQLLGLMAWLSRNKVKVSVANASEEIRETLAFTQLDTILDVQDRASGGAPRGTGSSTSRI